MLRSVWHRAIIVSVVLHCLLLLGIGWKVLDYPLTPKEERAMEVDILPDTKADVSPAVADSIVAASVPEEKQADSNEETKKEQPRSEKESDSSPAKNEPSDGKVSKKDIQTLTLSEYSKEQLEMALAQYNLILTMGSPVAFVYSDRGKVYYDKGDFDRALADFNQALVLDSHLPWGHIGRGFVYIKRSQWNLALEDFNQAIKTTPKNALAYYGRALCFINNNEKQKAINDFKAFIQLAKPEDSRLIQMSQQMLSELGE